MKVRLVLVMGLLLVCILMLLLYSGALKPRHASPPAGTPALVQPTPAPRATIAGLLEGSGPATNPQQEQEPGR